MRTKFIFPAPTATGTAPGPAAMEHAVNVAFDGVALLDAADEALARMIAALNGVRELVERARALPEERKTMAQEIGRRLAAIDAISAAARCNGHRILDGGLGRARFQVGAYPATVICIDLQTSARLTAVGAIAKATSSPLATVFGGRGRKGAYTTPRITDLNFFTALHHADLEVDGIPVGLHRDWSGDPEGAAAALQAKLNTDGGARRYRVTYVENRFTFTADTGPAPVLRATSARGLWFLGGTTVAAEPPIQLELTPGDFTLRIGAQPPHHITGRFSTPQALANVLNERITGICAGIDDATGALTIAAVQSIAITGKIARIPGGFAFAADSQPTGHLTAIALPNTHACCEARLRIDKALIELTALRSRFSANRKAFDDAIIRRNSAAIDDAVNILSSTKANLRQQGRRALLAHGNVYPGMVRMLLRAEYRGAGLHFCPTRCPAGKERCD